MPFPWPKGEGEKNPSERGERHMKHNLKICLVDQPDSGGIVRCRRVSMRERLLRCLFGKRQRITIIVPGDSVKMVSLQEVREVESHGSA